MAILQPPKGKINKILPSMSSNSESERAHDLISWPLKAHCRSMYSGCLSYRTSLTEFLSSSSYTAVEQGRRNFKGRWRLILQYLKKLHPHSMKDRLKLSCCVCSHVRFYGSVVPVRQVCWSLLHKEANSKTPPKATLTGPHQFWALFQSERQIMPIFI